MLKVHDSRYSLHGANCIGLFTNKYLCMRTVTTDAMRCEWLADHRASWFCEANKQKMHMHETSSTTVYSTYVASVSDFSHASFLPGFRRPAIRCISTVPIPLSVLMRFYRGLASGIEPCLACPE
jgi:hypothetical protein